MNLFDKNTFLSMTDEITFSFLYLERNNITKHRITQTICKVAWSKN
jgi:hypothetical protein